MKINKLFHWLYAFLMGLPLLSSLWIGLIWTFNENSQVPTITENVSREVDFNQLINDTNTYPLSRNGYDITYVDNTIYISGTGLTTGFYRILDFHFPTLTNNQYYLNINPGGTPQSNSGTWQLYIEGTINRYQLTSDVILTAPSNGTSVLRVAVYGDTLDCYFNANVINLTQMFGYGNEPTISEFNNWFYEDYYDYTLSKHIVIENYSTRQVLDSPVNYIWLPSFGGIGWTIENVFNSMVNGMFGLATSYGIGLTIVKLLTYWLCISLIWLIYDVIMYVPLMIHRWLDKGVIS